MNQPPPQVSPEERASLQATGQQISAAGEIYLLHDDSTDLLARWGEPVSPQIQRIGFAGGQLELRLERPDSSFWGAAPLLEDLFRLQRRLLRSGLSRRLHGTVCQELTAAKLELDLYAFDVPFSESLTTSRKLMSQAAASVRGLLQELADG